MNKQNVHRNSVSDLLYTAYILYAVYMALLPKERFDKFKGESINKLHVMFDT